MKFSVVCPIKDEVALIPLTLPSFYAVNPTEVILCLDNPKPPSVVEVIHKVAEAYGMEDKTRIVGVKRRSDFQYHQAWVRRKGFLEAEHDRILTVDIDLLLNRNVLTALEMVGENDVGLASIWKAKPLNSIVHIYTRFTRFYTLLRRRAGFCGLYALWRPFWLDSEPEDKIRQFIGIKQMWRGEHDMWNGDVPRGEDSYLASWMKKKHRCIHLLSIGATILREKPEYLRWFQRVRGQHAVIEGKQLRYAVLHTLLRAEPEYFRGYIAQKRVD